MSDEDKRNSAQDNTGHEPKPEGVAQSGVAPKGHLGHQPSTYSPAPGGTVRSRQSVEAVTGATNQQQAQPAKDDQSHNPERPYAIATGDPEHDKGLAKDHNVISREEAEQIMGKEKVGQTFYDEPSKDADAEAPSQQAQGDRPNFSKSDYAKAFRAARGNERRLQQEKSNDHEL